MNSDKKILLSGVKPTGRPHVGNYFGAMKQFVDLQNEHNSFVFIANYHALTTVANKDELEKASIDIALDYLAIGLDPQKTTLFLQSDVPEVTELAWIFNCITTMPFLMRAHAFKDAEAKSKEVNVGLFDYPVLMAADILIQNADVVPVGKDQKQHVEIARDTAEKFNRIFGDTFKLPEHKILEDTGIIPGIDGRKMSKSYGNTIPLFAEDTEIKKIVMSIVTDSKAPDETKNPEECNIFALHKLFSGDILDKLEERYKNGEIGYKESKEILVENVINFITPFREERSKLEKNKDEVLAILKNGGEIARGNARAKIKEVKEKVGLI
jgi:tryptophanyl-tRNA synthetase